MPKQIIRAKGLISLLLLLLPALATAAIYSWKDGNGKVHYGDRPPSDRTADQITTHVNTFTSSSQAQPFGLRLKRRQSRREERSLVIPNERRATRSGIFSGTQAQQSLLG